MAAGSPGRKSKARGAAAGRPREPKAPEPSGFLPDLLRRGLTLGFTGVFLTEEALRKALGDSMPRDVLEFILEQTERTRNELLERLSREFGRAVGALDPVEVVRRLLEGRSIEVTARFRLVPEESEAATAGRRSEDSR